MMSAQDYENKVWSIVGTIAQGKKIHLEWDTISEAKLHKTKIGQIQKELRILKKDISLEVKLIKSDFSAKKSGVGTGVGAGLAAGLFGKKSAGRMNALERERIRQKQLNTVLPYENINRLIDNIIVQFDSLKVQIDSWIVSNSTPKQDVARMQSK